MRATDKLLYRIRLAIESVEYGTVKITLSEKGEYIDIITEKHERVSKDSVQDT